MIGRVLRVLGWLAPVLVIAWCSMLLIWAAAHGNRAAVVWLVLFALANVALWGRRLRRRG